MALKKLWIEGDEKPTNEMLIGIAIFLLINFAQIVVHQYGFVVLPKSIAEFFSHSIPHIKSAVDFLKRAEGIPHSDAVRQAWAITHILSFVWISALIYWPIWTAWWIARLLPLYRENTPYHHPGSGFHSKEGVARRMSVFSASAMMLAVYIVITQLYGAKSEFLYEPAKMTERLFWYVFLTGVTMLSVGLSIYSAAVVCILRR